MKDAAFIVTAGGALLGEATMPDPTSFPMIGWVLVGLAALVTILNGLLNFYKAHIKESPPVAATYLTKVEFGASQASTEKWHDEVREKLDALNNKIEAFSSDQYQARGKMHKRINAHDRALSFIGGRMGAAAGDQVRQTLRAGEAESDEF